MPNEREMFDFKFYFVKDGVRSGVLFAWRGSLSAETLLLGEMAVPVSSILDTTVRDNRLIVQLAPDLELDGKEKKYHVDEMLILEINKGLAATVKRHIDRYCSMREIETRHQALIADGKGDDFRAELCGGCGAAIDLSELDATPYYYCRHCDSVMKTGGELVTDGTKYRHCDECNMFDRIKGYTEVYFYFLLVVYGYSYNRRHLCRSCAGTVFWKMLICNFIFVLGLPSTIWLKIQQLTDSDPGLKDLSQANAYALSGQMEKAKPLFEVVRANYADHPGILYNEAFGYLQAEDGENAVATLNRSMTACANHLPTLQLIAVIANALDDGETDGDENESADEMDA